MARWYLLFALVFGLVAATAQPYVTIGTAKGKAVKAYNQSVESGMAGQFEDALNYLEKALKAEPTFIDAYIQKGAVLFDARDYPEAEKAFRKALDLGPDYDSFVWYQLGLTQMRMEAYGDAIPAFERYLAKPNIRDRYQGRAQRYLVQCRFSSEAMANPVPFKPRELGKNINTEEPEYLPSLTADGKTLVFTRVVQGQEDLYFSRWEEGDWAEARPLEELNTPYNEGAHTISADGRLLLFTSCNREDGVGRCDLYFSAFQAGRWSPPQNLGKPVNTSAWESQPSLSANGRQLYFASDRTGGQGRNDIWVSERNPDGSWGNPRPLSDSINTPGMDQSPFIHPDGQTLYFMSDGHPGMGQTDLYYSRLRPDGKWGKPINMGYPINTMANEGALVVGLSGEKAYFATDRADIAQRPPEGRIPYSNIFEFDLYPKARPRPVTYLLVKVLDAQTGDPLLAQADVLDLEDQDLFASSITNEKGELLVCLPAGRDYALNVNKKDYLFYSENFALADSFSLNRPFRVEAALEPVGTEAGEESKPIVLRNVFFETGSAALLPQSRAELDRLVLLLKENPNIRIRINGHTDNVGSEEDNLALSDARAASVLAYLIQAGIADARLESKGYGESEPIATNETVVGRKLNRRTEFVVIK